MIRHIVAWDLKEDTQDSEREDKIAYIRLQLESLYPAVPQLKELKVVTTEILKNRSNKEILLNTLFEDEKSLEEYIVHPVHQEVVKNISHLLDNKSVVDFIE